MRCNVDFHLLFSSFGIVSGLLWCRVDGDSNEKTLSDQRHWPAVVIFIRALVCWKAQSMQVSCPKSFLPQPFAIQLVKIRPQCSIPNSRRAGKLAGHDLLDHDRTRNRGIHHKQHVQVLPMWCIDEDFLHHGSFLVLVVYRVLYNAQTIDPVMPDT